MKTKIISLLTIFITTGIAPVFATTEEPQTITVSGKVLQSDNPVQYVIISALYSNNTPINNALTSSDANGEFTLENIPSDAFIQASYAGSTQKEKATQNMTINLNSQQVDEVVIQINPQTECQKYPAIMKWQNGECVCKDKTKELKNWHNSNNLFPLMLHT